MQNEEDILRTVLNEMARHTIKQAIGKELEWDSRDVIVDMFKNEAERIMAEPEIKQMLRDRIVKLLTTYK